MINFWHETHERIMKTELVESPAGRLPTSEYRERLVAEVADVDLDPVLTLGRLSPNLINRWMVEAGVPEARLARVRRTLTVDGPDGSYHVVTSRPLQCWTGVSWRAPSVPFQTFREWLAARLGQDSRAGRLAARLEAERTRCALVAEWPGGVWAHLVRHAPSATFAHAWQEVVAEYRAYVRETATQAALTTQGDPGRIGS